MDSTFSFISNAVKSKGIGIKKATHKDVDNALRSEGINADNYNFSMEDGKKDIYIDAYEKGGKIYLYKGYGSSQALCHEFIHKWWKHKGNKSYVSKIKEMFPDKWEEISNDEEYSIILDNEDEICGEVLAKSYEEELADFIANNKENLTEKKFLLELGSKHKNTKISELKADDITEIICYDMFNGTKWENEISTKNSGACKISKSEITYYF